MSIKRFHVGKERRRIANLCHDRGMIEAEYESIIVHEEGRRALSHAVTMMLRCQDTADLLERLLAIDTGKYPVVLGADPVANMPPAAKRICMAYEAANMWRTRVEELIGRVGQ